MVISVVSTLYKSKSFLNEFLDETKKALQELEITDYELIFVNDGSPDDSMEYLLSLNNPKIQVIDLSRNFGHHYALQAGLKQTKGEYVFLIDNDLETPPSILLEMYKKIINDNTLDVVYGYQIGRKGGLVEKYLGGLFWILINKLSDTKIPHNILTERVMTRQYVDSLLSLNDANLFLGGMMYWVGFNQLGIPVQKKQRKEPSTYTIKKRLDLMIQAITSFSGKPLVYLFYFGLTVSFFSILFIFYLIVKKIVYLDQVQLGWTSLVAVSVLTLGVLSTFLGIIGIYIHKIFSQVQGRPNFIIKKINKSE